MADGGTCGQASLFYHAMRLVIIAQLQQSSKASALSMGQTDCAQSHPQ